MLCKKGVNSGSYHIGVVLVKTGPYPLFILFCMGNENWYEIDEYTQNKVVWAAYAAQTLHTLWNDMLEFSQTTSRRVYFDLGIKVGNGDRCSA